MNSFHYTHHQISDLYHPLLLLKLEPVSRTFLVISRPDKLSGIFEKKAQYAFEVSQKIADEVPNNKPFISFYFNSDIYKNSQYVKKEFNS